MECIGDQNLSLAEIVKGTGIPYPTVSRNCEDMEALGIVGIDRSGPVEHRYMLTPRFRGLRSKAAALLA
jgi:DNA-binding IclR family transcriptional regulator